MFIYEFSQQSAEWFNVRKGKITASHAQAIGNCGKGLDTYINEIMSEYYSSKDRESFSNKHTERGNELEAIARDIYELQTGNKVDLIGFVEYNEFVGCSPDGFVGEDGGIEIKCPDDKEYFKLLLNGKSEIDSGYIWQVQMNLLITGRKWWDLVFYNPNYKKSMFIYRIIPDKEKQDRLLEGFKLAEDKIKNIINQLTIKMCSIK